MSRTYDAAGNTTAIDPEKGFVYDDANRLAQVTHGGTVTMNCAYNGNGERARRFNGTEDVYTLYDEAGRWLGDYDAANVPMQQAIWLDDLPVEMLIIHPDGIQRTRYIEPDALGTPRVVHNSKANKVVWAWDLAGEAFGASPPNQDPDGDGWIGGIGGAKSATQALEDSMKAQRFQSSAECENAARQAMQQLLQSGARQTAIDSHRRWDASGRHTQVVPGP